MLALQRTIGNRAVQQMLNSWSLQPKLVVGAPDDAYEQEADKVAEEVVSRQGALQRQAIGSGSEGIDDEGSGRAFPSSVPAALQRIPIKKLRQTLGNRALTRFLDESRRGRHVPELQRKGACGGESEEECAECKSKRLSLQRRATGAEAGSEAPPIVEEVLGTPGQPLAESARRTLEPSFGYDFSQVRVHNDAKAAESAGSVSALAYTVGDHIVFNSGQYAPGTTAGNRLLAHELTHTIQQSGGTMLASDMARLPQPEDRQVQRDSDGAAQTDQATAAPANQFAAPPPASPDQPPADLESVSLEPLAVETESQGPTVEGGCDGLSLHGQATPTFNRSSTVGNQKATKSEGCDCAPGVQCIHVTGTRVTTYSVSVAISMPSVPGGLTPCERGKVQNFLNNVLRPHELDHKTRFETYNGQTRTPLDITGCGRDDVNSQLGALQEAENTPRQAAAQALSDAIDPFVRTIDCSDCEQQHSTAPIPGPSGSAEPAIATKRMSAGGDVGLRSTLQATALHRTNVIQRDVGSDSYNRGYQDGSQGQDSDPGPLASDCTAPGFLDT